MKSGFSRVERKQREKEGRNFRDRAYKAFKVVSVLRTLVDFGMWLFSLIFG